MSSAVGAARPVLGYPASEVSLPGSGDAAAARLTRLTSTSLFGDGQPNDREGNVVLSIVAPDGVGSGDLVSLRFDCLGAAPVATAFGCTLEGVVGTDGVSAVAGATCAARVATE